MHRWTGSNFDISKYDSNSPCGTKRSRKKKKKTKNPVKKNSEINMHAYSSAMAGLDSIIQEMEKEDDYTDGTNPPVWSSTDV